MAEFIMKDLVKKAGREGEFEVESAAISLEEVGNPVYPPAKRELLLHGISSDGKRARKVRSEDFERFDLLIGMEERHVSYLVRHSIPGTEGKIKRLLDYTSEPKDIADPWYTGEYALTYQEILRGCEGLFESLK